MLGLRSLMTRLTIAPAVANQQMVNLAPTQLVTRSLSTTDSVERFNMDKKWIRRRMKHHRMMKIRQRNAVSLAEGEDRRFKASLARKKAHIDSVWQDYGLEEEPARLTGAEKDALTKRYIEEGVFNEVMTPVEIRAYQTSFPLYFAVNKMRYVPRAYREGNIPYEGVKNPIPLERMKDPETGDFYPLADIKKYQTKKHLKENERIRRKGFYGNQRARNEDGYTSLRDTKQFHEIGHHLRLSTEWAQNPGHDPRFFKRPRLSGKVKMFFANKGYFEKDFQMPWRFWMIHKDTSIAESGMMNPSPFLRHKAKFGWRDVENFHHEEISSFQHMRRMPNCRHMYKYRWKEWKEGRKHHSERPQE